MSGVPTSDHVGNIPLCVARSDKQLGVLNSFADNDADRAAK